MSKPIGKGKEITGSIAKELDRRFLSSLDLAGCGDVKVKIDRVEKHAKLDYLNGNSENNALLCYFEGSDKPLKLNTTNIRAIIGALGTNVVKDWNGREIVLAVKRVQAFGKTVDAVRVVG